MGGLCDRRGRIGRLCASQSFDRGQGTRVILLEAGGKDTNPYIHIPTGFMKLLDHPTLTWGFKADKASGLNGRRFLIHAVEWLGGARAPSTA